MLPSGYEIIIEVDPVEVPLDPVEIAELSGYEALARETVEAGNAQAGTGNGR